MPIFHFFKCVKISLKVDAIPKTNCVEVFDDIPLNTLRVLRVLLCVLKNPESEKHAKHVACLKKTRATHSVFKKHWFCGGRLIGM